VSGTPKLSGSNSRLGVDIALILPEVRPWAALDRAEVRDLHDALAAVGHEDEVAVEIENLDAVARCFEQTSQE
jgi:hypothetical protein